MQSHSKRWRQDIVLEDLSEILALEGDPSAADQSQLDTYLRSIGAEVVPASKPEHIAAEVLHRYFAAEAPFERRAKKRHEFPDAFVLLSLESLPASNSGLMICVSPDKGWKDFAYASSSLVCVDDLELALSLFNDSVRSTVDQVMALWKSGAAPDLAFKVYDALGSRLDDVDFIPEGSSGLYFAAEPLCAVPQFIDIETARDPAVIAVDEEQLTFTINVEAMVAFEANFDFFVKDSIDRDYLLLSSETFECDDRVGFHVALTIERNV